MPCCAVVLPPTQTGLRTLSLPAMSSLFGADGAAVDEAVRDTAKRCSTELRQRAAQELPLLPFSRLVAVCVVRCAVRAVNLTRVSRAQCVTILQQARNTRRRGCWAAHHVRRQPPVALPTVTLYCQTRHGVCQQQCLTFARQTSVRTLPLPLPLHNTQLHTYVLLPCSEAQAQAACDVRNSRYDKRLQAAVEELAESAGSGPGLPPSNSFPDRLNQAEKVAGKFVAKRIRPALQRAREKELPELLSESRDYLKGLWSRLNGGTAGGSRKALPPELKLPANSQKEVDKVRVCVGR